MRGEEERRGKREGRREQGRRGVDKEVVRKKRGENEGRSLMVSRTEDDTNP